MIRGNASVRLEPICIKYISVLYLDRSIGTDFFSWFAVTSLNLKIPFFESSNLTLIRHLKHYVDLVMNGLLGSSQIYFM